MNVTDGTWPDNCFSSDVIEELIYRERQEVKKVDGQIQIHLFFEPDKARDFVSTWKAAQMNPLFHRQLLQFVGYIARVVEIRLEADDDDK